MTDPVLAIQPVTVLERQWLNQDAFVLTCSRPAGFTFVAGQHVVLRHGGEEREYTLLTPPDASVLRFLVKRLEVGRLSNALAGMAMGTVLDMGRAKGYLTYRSAGRPVVFVATGVGIAPFEAMAAAGVTGFILIQGARNLSGLFFREHLASVASRYIPCVSEAPDGGDLPELFRGRVTGFVERHLQPGNYDFYLCGSRTMITDMTLLLDRHCPTSRVFSEAYS